MADVKIRVIADASNAIKNIQDITDGGLEADKSLSSLGKALSKLEARQRKGENVSSEYNKLLKQSQDQLTRTGNAALAAGKGYEEYLKILEKGRYAFFKAGATGAASSFDDQIKDLTKVVIKLRSQQDTSRLDKVKAEADAIALAAKKQKEHNDEVERLVSLAKNDPVEHMRYVYSQLDKQLRDNIDTQVSLKEEHKHNTEYMAQLKQEASGLTKRMSELNVQMKKASRTPLNERMSNLVKSFVSAQVVVWGLRKIFAGFTKVLKESASAAAYAEETYNLFMTTFEQVGTKADRVAISLGNSLGLATSSAQKALGAFGDLMKGYGATDAEALKFAETAARTALDIISFKNIAGSTDEIMQSFASGLAGNVENFRKLGYVITQAEVKALLAKKGLDGLTGSALQQAMVQARLELVIKKATNAIGDMEKTIDSTVNVERRLNEAWIEYKENLGEDVNKVMSPLKRWWLEILETTNKANEAKDRFMSGKSTAGIYDLSDRNGEDFDRFSGELHRIIDAHNRNPYSTEQSLFANIAGIMGQFHATVEDLEAALSETDAYYVKDWMKDSLLISEQDRIIKEQEDREFEEAVSALLSNAQAVQGFLDSISALKGASVSASAGWYLNAENAQMLAGNKTNPDAGILGANTMGMKGLIQAIVSMSGADWQKFVSPVDLALGKIDERGGLEAKVKELEALYELAYNFAMQDGKLTDQENNSLKSIINVRKDVLDQLEEMDKAEKNKAKIEEDQKKREEERNNAMIASINNTQDFIDSLNDLNGGHTGADASKFLALRNFGGITESGLQTLGYNAVEQMVSSMEKADWSDFVSPIERAMEGITTTGSLEAATSELKTFYTMAYNFAMQDGEIDEKEAEQLERIVAIRQEALNQLSEEEKAELAKTQKEAEESALRDFGVSSLGDIGAIIEAFSNAGASMEGWIGLLVKIASELEIVQRIGNTFSEIILPILNQLLEPLMSTLDVLFDIVVEFLANALEPVYTLLKAVTPLINSIVELLRPLLQILDALQPVLDLIIKGVALIVGIVNGAIRFVVDTLKWFAGWVMKGILGFVNGCIDLLNKIPFVNIDRVDTSKYDKWAAKNPLDSFQEGFDEVQNAINKGNGLLDDIKGNTDKDKTGKLQYLEELYRGGLLSATEYYAQRGSITGERWDRTQLWSKGTYYNGAGNTVVRYGDVTVNINGTDLTAEEVAAAFEKEMRGGAKGFQVAF